MFDGALRVPLKQIPYTATLSINQNTKKLLNIPIPLPPPPPKKKTASGILGAYNTKTLW